MENTQAELVKAIEGMAIIDYDLEKDNNLNYLVDYTKFLINTKHTDEKILNWQAENSALLKPLGLDFKTLKDKLAEKNKKYYKYDSLIGQISYRLEKHGKLAPTKEIAKKYDPKDLERVLENKDGDPQNQNEINYYDLNDPFINDDEVASDNSQNEFFNITLAYGNHTEEEVIRNLTRAKKMKKSTKSKKDAKAKDAMVVDSTGLSTLTTIKGQFKKRKFGEMENALGGNSPDIQEGDYISEPNTNFLNQEKEKNEKEAAENEKEMKILNSNIEVLPTSITFFDETIDGIIRESMVNNEISKEPKDVINLLKKLIVHYKKVKDDDCKSNIFLSKLSDLLSITFNDLKLIFEFETNKVKREGIFSNVAKLINKFVVNLTENNIRNISDKSIFLENAELKEKLTSLIGKITVYIESVQTVCDFVNQEDFDQRIEKLFPINKTGKMSILEGKDKVLKKFRENLEKNQLTYDERIFISVMNQLIDPYETTSYFEYSYENEDINKIIEIKPAASNIICDTPDTIPREISTPFINDVINLCNESREEKENCLNIMTASPVKSKKAKPTTERKNKKNKDENVDKLNFENSQDKNGQKKPVFSKRFFFKQFDEKDFNPSE